MTSAQKQLSHMQPKQKEGGIPPQKIPHAPKRTDTAKINIFKQCVLQILHPVGCLMTSEINILDMLNASS